MTRGFLFFVGLIIVLSAGIGLGIGYLSWGSEKPESPNWIIKINNTGTTLPLYVRNK